MSCTRASKKRACVCTPPQSVAARRSAGMVAVRVSSLAVAAAAESFLPIVAGVLDRISARGLCAWMGFSRCLMISLDLGGL
jgi:hypothetical protein